MDSAEILLSVVSPVYRAEKIIPELVRRIGEACSKVTEKYEIILVEDRGPDNSWEAICTAAAQDPRVKGIRFSRNYGQHYGITAGLDAAQGEYTVVIDCDLQDNPDYIPEMVKLAHEGYDIVLTEKEKRAHSFFKNFTAGIFFRVFNYLSDNQQANSSVGAYSLMNRKVREAFCRIKDAHRHYLMVLRLLGFKTTSLRIQHVKRFEGKSSYDFMRLVKHAVNGITSQSDKLLRLSISLGFIFFCVSILYTIVLVVRYLLHGAYPGYTSLMAVILLSTGLILMSIGIAGIYIGKIFEQVKDRPLYIVDEKINC